MLHGVTADSLIALALLVGLACGDGGGDGSAAGTDTGGTASTATPTTTDSSTTVAATTIGTASSTDVTGDTSSDTGSDTGEVQAAYFVLQSAGFQISLLGNFLAQAIPVAGAFQFDGACRRQNQPDFVGQIAPGGAVTVRRGDEVLLVASPTPSAAIAMVTLAPGDVLAFDMVAPDGLLPDVTVEPLVVPSFATAVAELESVIIGQPVTVTWTPPAAAEGLVKVTLTQAFGGQLPIVDCVVAVSDGSVTVPASLLDHLLPTDEDNPVVQIAVSAFAEIITEVDGKTVELELQGLIDSIGPPAVVD